MANPHITLISYDTELPLAVELVAIINTRFGGELTERAYRNGPDGITLTMPSGQINLVLMPMPLATGELIDDAAQLHAWPTWKEGIKRWRSHIAMFPLFPTAGGFEGMRAQIRDQMRIAAAVASGTRASAIGSSASRLYMQTTGVVDALTRETVPFILMVRPIFRQEQTPTGPAVGIRTLGLAAFDLPEIDYPATGEDPDTIYEWVINCAAYLINEGPVLKEGHTIGFTSAIDMRVHHATDANGTPVIAFHK